MKIGRLFLGMARTNEMAYRNYTVASWAYETGYWRWAMWWAPFASWRKAVCLPRIGPGMASGTKWSVGTMVSFWFVVPFIGSFSVTTQPRMDSMKYYRQIKDAA